MFVPPEGSGRSRGLSQWESTKDGVDLGLRSSRFYVVLRCAASERVGTPARRGSLLSSRKSEGAIFRYSVSLGVGSPVK